jgi:DNA-binding transcriptional LysR family regulator
MARANVNDLVAFVAVARERSFTRAAAQLGVSPSALSHTLRGLEERLGVRLLTRTTRSVTPTEAGERLLRTIGPRLDEIEAEVEALAELRDKPAGTIRLTATEHATETIVLPALERILPLYPDIKVEIVIDYGLTDIVAERIDAGIRTGEQVAKDMIAVRIGPDMCMAAAASPVEGQLVFNSAGPMVKAALAGLGIAFLPDTHLQRHLDSGALVRLLADWCPPFPGYHLYYPSRRQPTAAFSLLVEALRYRGAA